MAGRLLSIFIYMCRTPALPTKAGLVVQQADMQGSGCCAKLVFRPKMEALFFRITEFT
jgi:hypothetical protein